MANGALALHPEAELFIEGYQMPLNHDNDFPHVGMLANLFKIGSHHGFAIALSPERWFNDDTVDAEDIAYCEMVLHGFLGDRAGIIWSSCGADKTNKVGLAVHEGDEAQMLGDHGTVLDGQRGSGLIRREAGFLQLTNTGQVNDLNVLQVDIGLLILRGAGSFGGFGHFVWLSCEGERMSWVR